MDNRIFRRYHREYISAPCGEGRGDPRGLIVGQRQSDGTIAVGFSRCSEKDTFSKKVARLIAENRLKSNKFVVDPNNEANVELFLDDLEDMGFEDLVDEATWIINRCSR